MPIMSQEPADPAGAESSGEDSGQSWRSQGGRLSSPGELQAQVESPATPQATPQSLRAR